MDWTMMDWAEISLKYINWWTSSGSKCDLMDIND
jgi:hypothetical protein